MLKSMALTPSSSSSLTVRWFHLKRVSVAHGSRPATCLVAHKSKSTRPVWVTSSTSGAKKNYPKPGSIRKIRIEGITLNGEFLTGIDLGSNKAIRIDPMDFVVTKGVLPGFQGYQLGQTFPNAHGSLNRIVGYMPKFDRWYIVELGDSGQRLMVSKKAAEVRFNRVRSIDRADYLQVIETYRTGTKQIDQQFQELVDTKAEAKLKQFCDELFIDREITVTGLTLESRKFGKHKIYESFEPRGPFGKYVFSLDPKFTYGLNTKISGTCSY